MKLGKLLRWLIMNGWWLQRSPVSVANMGGLLFLFILAFTWESQPWHTGIKLWHIFMMVLSTLLWWNLHTRLTVRSVREAVSSLCVFQSQFHQMLTLAVLVLFSPLLYLRYLQHDLAVASFHLGTMCCVMTVCCYVSPMASMVCTLLLII